MAAYEQRLRDARDAFVDRCDWIAEDIRRQLVIPFCRKHRLVFKGGMGTWCFFSADTGTYRQLDRFDVEKMRGTKRLLAALDLEVDANNTIGTSYVRDVNRGDL